MFERFTLTVGAYCDFYATFLQQQWQQMTPMKYGALLMGIGAAGYLLMRSSVKRL